MLASLRIFLSSVCLFVFITNKSLMNGGIIHLGFCTGEKNKNIEIKIRMQKRQDWKNRDVECGRIRREKVEE